MLQKYLRRKTKVFYGIVNTYLKPKGEQITRDWWEGFYSTGVSDRQTISPYHSKSATRYHYVSIEKLILKHFRNNGLKDLNQKKVLDIGSGAGHWLDFYKSLGASDITGMDISQSSYNHLREKYLESADVTVHHGKAHNIIKELNTNFDIVNAIGVMFHILDDEEWSDTIKSAGKILKRGGSFVIGGHFGLLNNLNVQIDSKGNINKKIRSKSHWRTKLKEAGFTNISFYKNNSYLWIKEKLPEANILIATKG